MFSLGVYVCVFVCVCLSLCLTGRFNHGGLVLHKQYLAYVSRTHDVIDGVTRSQVLLMIYVTLSIHYFFFLGWMGLWCFLWYMLLFPYIISSSWGGWGCDVSCGHGHHWHRGKTTTGSALDGAVLDITQILAYLAHNMSRSQLYLGFGHFGWLPSAISILSGLWLITFWRYICWNYSFSSGWHIIAALGLI